MILICPCEDLTEGDVRFALSLGATTMDDVKRLTRCGMGYCQGLYCTPAVRALLDDPPAPFGLRRRVPVRPVTLEGLAALADNEDRQSSMLAF